MIRYTILLAIALAVSQVAKGQVTISYDGGVGESNVVDSAGMATNGDTVSIGTFTNGFDPTIPANADNLAALQAHWATFDSTTTRNILGIDGRFGATSPAVNNPIFDKQQIYFFITESSGGNVTEYGLFTSTNNADWVFPVHDSGTSPNPIDSNEVNQFLFGDGISSGSSGSLTPGSLQTAVLLVPEPGGVALLSVGLAVLGSSFRRRNR